jgi:PAS domain S-box-containing protein
MTSTQQAYEALIQALDGIVWEADAATLAFSFVSQQAERLLGYPVADWLKTPGAWLEHLHPEDRERAVSYCKAQAAAGRDHVFEYRMVAADGRVVWLQDRVSVLDDGGRRRLRGVMIDITERKHAEDTFRGLLEAAPDAMVIVDAAGCINRVNTQTERLFGWSREELLGQPVERLVPRRYRAAHQQHRAAYASSPRVRGMGTGQALFGVRKDGSEFPVEISLAPLQTPSGQVVTAAIRDATERRRVEEALIEGQKRLADAQEIAHFGSWEWSITENTVRWSDELYRIYGLAPGESPATYEAYLARVHPEDRARVHDLIQRAYRSQVPFAFEERIVRPSGEVRWLQSRGRVTADLRGQPVRMTGTCQDITDRKHVEAELAARAAALERSNEDLEHFASVASHDLQEPLRTVASYAQLLERRRPGGDEKAQEYVRFITDGVHRMQDLIGDLLTYSRVSRQTPAAVPTALADALADALANLDGAVKESDARVTHDRLPVVAGDRSQLALVFQNLLSNAIKFRSIAPLRVHVGARHEDDHWLLSVRDNGIGIDPAHFDKMFVLFQRLHSRERYPGTGLGLAICKKIVMRYGGRIWLTSDGPGSGTTFWFTLPEARAPE